MAQNNSQNPAQNLLEGIVDGILLKHFWNFETQESHKSLSYLVGNIVAVEINPLALGELVYDLVRGNYRLKEQLSLLI